SRVGDGVLGFRETGLNPGPDAALTIAAELGAVVVLAVGVVAARPERPSPAVA
ncbi:MAG: hypothetical protein H0W25_12550, partial [Acidimicrobiia bacterium]|nr:hypothetical protein [Acidimicrobiia bacterium]